MMMFSFICKISDRFPLLSRFQMHACLPRGDDMHTSPQSIVNYIHITAVFTELDRFQNCLRRFQLLIAALPCRTMSHRSRSRSPARRRSPSPKRSTEHGSKRSSRSRSPKRRSSEKSSRRSRSRSRKRSKSRSRSRSRKRSKSRSRSRGGCDFSNAGPLLTVVFESNRQGPTATAAIHQTTTATTTKARSRNSAPSRDIRISSEFVAFFSKAKSDDDSDREKRKKKKDKKKKDKKKSKKSKKKKDKKKRKLEEADGEGESLESAPKKKKVEVGA